MGQIDPAQERARLSARYAAMSDLELQKIGKVPSQLTEWSRLALVEEMKKRGLEWQPEPRDAKPITEEEILLRVAGYADRYRARLDRDVLANAGIKVFFCEEERPRAEKRPAAKEGSEIQLLVRAKDLAAARQLLADSYEAERAMGEQSTKTGEVDRPVVLRRYRDMPKAVVEKSVLEGAGIECFLQDDNVVRMDWLWSNAMGGIKLLVREKDAEEAEKILKQAPFGASDGPASEEP